MINPPEYNQNSQNMLRVENLKVGYKIGGGSKPVLDIENLSASKGELVALIGLNGIGKSTLMKTMAALIPALSGTVLINKQLLSSYSRPALARLVTYISAGQSAFSQFTVEELVSLGRHPHTNWLGRLSSQDRQQVQKSMTMVGLDQLSAQSVQKISDGERQRAQIARALAQDTPVILMDEPTAFLDVVNRYSITWLLKELCEKEGKTIVFSTHDWNVALHAAHKIWLLLPGNCREGAPEDLAINGDIQILMSNSALNFNLETGRITVPQATRGHISLSLSDSNYQWASHMLERIGYKIVANSGLILSFINKMGWTLTDEEHNSLHFSTLYELSIYLASGSKSLPPPSND
jgi:iron complex transport system ATP-binding protein